MSDTKFTPGPWAVDKDLEVSIDVDDEDNGQIASGWKTIASVTHAGFCAVVVDMNSPNQWDDELMDANAHLIAAAPDLYEALAEAFASDAVMNCPPWIAKARAALAKARGETA